MSKDGFVIDPDRTQISVKILISILVTCIGAASGGAWWLSSINGKVNQLLERHAQSMNQTEQNRANIIELKMEHLRLETKVGFLESRITQKAP